MAGDFAGAEEDYTRALLLDPGLAAALVNRGRLREATGNLAGAPVDDWIRVTDEEALPVLFDGIRLELHRFLVVAEISAADPWHQAGVRAGDVIESVNGREPNGSDALRALLREAADAGRATSLLVLLRGESGLRVEVPSAAPTATLQMGMGYRVVPK